ncbi:F0F1 ATP synthase subunit A [uncultured Algibacter sp.]|uniref:F0F1 ATP synthase subunit A n=1 Tax=uncultured Algibacter sp. TaxID=298659 RepID=UPI0026179EAB|nr:F0F1 ATP synthase subunit A [uncultured Algibacter sp.]
MQNIISRKTICLLFLMITTFSFAKEEKHEGEGDIKTEIKEYINHHLLDSHDFSLTSYTNGAGEHKYIGFPLPVILWDNGLKIFSSSKFHHGESVAEVNGEYYTLFHNKVYKTDAAGTINLDDDHHPTNIKPIDFSITKNVFTIFLVGLLMFVMFSRMAKKYKTGSIPRGMGRFLEPIILYIRDDIAVPNIGEKKYKRYMPYLLTVFFFIWIINLLGLTPLGVNVTNNIAVTLALALITYFLTTFTANKNYWGHIFWMPGVPTPMKIILAPIELLGTIIKPFSLMIRLYANITAGHIVLMSIIGLMFIFKNWIGSSLSFGLAFALSLLELLVAALQAYIFTMLSALYFGSAVEEHHEDH